MSGPVEVPADCVEPWADPLGDDVDAGYPAPAAVTAEMVAVGLRLISRSRWGARPARPGVQMLGATRGTKIHYTGSYVNPSLLEDHRRCAPAVRQIQAGHMDGNGWLDIGYSLVCCPHRYVFEGRGLHRLPAANGPGLNSGHYAVCALLGSRGLIRPSPGLLHALRDAIGYLQARGSAGGEVRGHRDGYATDCPGDPLYEWVRHGAPRPSEDDDMQLTDMVPIGQTYDDQWQHDAYPVSFVMVAAASEAKRARAGINKGMDEIIEALRDLPKMREEQNALRAELAELRAMLSAQRPLSGPPDGG